MRLPSILLTLIALTGCSARHYQVCIATSKDFGCSQQRFTKKTATVIGELMAGEPSDGDRTVFLRDTKKHAEDKSEIREPHPVEAPRERSDKL